MKFRICFVGEGEVSLPVQYKHIVQAAFLQWLQDNEYVSFVHNDGYNTGKRNYKLYVISDILSVGRKSKDGRCLIFSTGVQLIVSSCISDMDDAIIRSIEEEHPFILGKQELYVESYEEIEESYTDCVVKVISPITIHSTFELPCGSKKTYYYSATEKNFTRLIQENLIRKYISIYGVEPEDTRFVIQPVNDKKLRKVIVNYKSTIIVGWMGEFIIRGNPELIRIALLCGIGSRNGIGMGGVLQKNLIIDIEI